MGISSFRIHKIVSQSSITFHRITSENRTVNLNRKYKLFATRRQMNFISFYRKEKPRTQVFPFHFFRCGFFFLSLLSRNPGLATRLKSNTSNQMILKCEFYTPRKRNRTLGNVRLRFSVCVLNLISHTPRNMKPPLFCRKLFYQ